MMTQALHHGRWILTPGPDGTEHAYTELCSGSKNVTGVVRNSMAYPQTLRKKTPVVKAVAVTWLPDPPVQTSLTEVHQKRPMAIKCPS